MTGGSAASPASRESTLGWFAAVCVVTLLAYAGSFTAPFQLDDYGHVINSPELERAGWDAFFRFARARVLPLATLALNRSLNGDDPFGYHVVNFAIHLLATFAVYRLAQGLCLTPRLRDSWLAAKPLPFAVAAGFVFACHPIQIQAVTYIVQRMSSMATLFYVGSVCVYVRARNAQLGLVSGRPTFAFAASLLLALAAFLSKENSASLPLAIVLTEWTFYPTKTGKSGVRRWLRLAPFLALVAIIPLLWWLFGIRPGGAPAADATLAEHARYLVSLLTFRAHPRGQISLLEYLLTQCLVIPRYLRLVFLPWGFNIDHEVPLAQGFSAWVGAGLVFLVSLLGFGFYALRRWPVVGFGILWVFVALSVESSLLPLQDFMVEHRMYLAMPGLALVAGTSFAWALARQRPAALAAATAVLAGLCTLTFLRNELWRNPVFLWQDAMVKSPGKARVYANLGTALHHSGKLDEAIDYYCKALALDPKNRTAESNINAILEEKVEKGSDEPMIFEGRSGKPGQPFELELTPRHPCSPKR